MRDTKHLAWRAALAIALMVSFYVLALAVAGVLLAVPWLLWSFSKGAMLKVGLFCLVGAFLILKAILPRPDRFEPPGPLLTPDAQPRLFAEIRDLATRTGQDDPAEVYLIPDVNAWVAQRGGFMGIGSRRIMGLGLPLLQTLTLPELRGVLAHEFGHFHGGDVAIGPWIYKTRAALIRTVSELAEHSRALSQLFIWYGNLFFRITHAVSRHQEVLADRLAVGIVGVEALASGLRGSNSAGLAFLPYWQGFVAPVLSAGFVPPLAAGFEAFLSTPSVAGQLAEALKQQALHEKPDPFDTHPPLAERLAALGVGRGKAPRVEGPPSLSLLDDVPALEAALVKVLAGGKSKGALGWNEVGRKVWLPMWEGYAPDMKKALAGVTPASLPELEWERVGRRLLAGNKGDPKQAAAFAVGVGLALVLAKAGFTVETYPGASHALVGLGERVEVFGVRERLASGPEAVEAWLDLCARAGIADADLGTACALSRTPKAGA
jgi:Zn-dependent protease with chaperone function